MLRSLRKLCINVATNTQARFVHGVAVRSVLSRPMTLRRCSDMAITAQTDKRPRVHRDDQLPLSMRPQTVQGFVYYDHWIHVPLDHNDPDGKKITVFAREVRLGLVPMSLWHVHTGDSRMHPPVQVCAINKHATANLPYLCYFQGGPGFQSPVPDDGLCCLNSATKTFRVVLLDQRGTGKSTPVRQSTLSAIGDDSEQAKYLHFFRADSIVEDAELVRQQLCPDKPWSIIGQSFGGFCCVEYLSKYPESALLPFVLAKRMSALQSTQARQSATARQ
jgi:hypothetical protein